MGRRPEEGRSRRIAARAILGSTLYELSQGGWIAYHFHHGSEEVPIVLRGLKLRTPAGTRDAVAGDVVHFPIGAEGAHATRSRTRRTKCALSDGFDSGFADWMSFAAASFSSATGAAAPKLRGPFLRLT